MKVWTLASLGLVCLASACHSGPTPTPAPTPIPTPTPSPLVGKIWDARRSHFVGPDDVYAQLAEADFALLGEKHDDPEHHALQAKALEAIAQRKRPVALALEMLDATQQETVDAYLARPDASARGFGEAVAWKKSGWPAYEMYEPILGAAFAAKAPVVAANLPHAEARAIVNDATQGASDARLRGILGGWSIPDAQANEQLDEMRVSHCGKLPEPMLVPMAFAQRARDATMGARMIASRSTGREIVLVTGNGHARTDRGVPSYLYAKAPGSRVVSVSFQEAPPTQREPEPAPYDFVWYTPWRDEGDPCANVKKKL